MNEPERVYLGGLNGSWMLVYKGGRERSLEFSLRYSWVGEYEDVFGSCVKWLRSRPLSSLCSCPHCRGEAAEQEDDEVLGQLCPIRVRR